MNDGNKKQILWWSLIVVLVAGISILHYTTPTMKWQYHLIFMQSYFIPILLGAFQFGVRGGLGVAIAVSVIYFPHIMLQWGGLSEGNLMRFLQIVLFNAIAFLTGLKAQQQQEEKLRYQKTAQQLQKSIQQIKQQTEKLEGMEEQLQMADRLALIGEMTASLAHEIRNPLGSIRGTVDILKDEIPNNEKTSEFLNIMVEETSRLSAVVENYLNFAKRRKYQISRFDTKEVIRNVILLLESRARRSGATLKSQLPEEPLMMESDANQLRQILVNLTLNAVQAIPDEGEVQIKAGLIQDRSTVVLELLEHPEQFRILSIKVSDNGTGIQQDKLEEIFQPFYSTKEQGTGLGLAIVKRMVNQNNWRLDVKSEVDRGTEFELLIPVKK